MSSDNKNQRVAPRVLSRETVHGDVIDDYYAYLADEKDPRTKHWLAANDQYARSQLNTPRRAALRHTFSQLYRQQKMSVPIVRVQAATQTSTQTTTATDKSQDSSDRDKSKGDSSKRIRLFFSKREPDEDKAKWFLEEYVESSTGEHMSDSARTRRLLIDPLQIDSTGKTSIHAVSPSVDGAYVAYQRSVANQDQGRMYVRDVDTGKELIPEGLSGARYGSAQWYKTPRTLGPRQQGFVFVRLPDDPKIPAAELPGHQEVVHYAIERQKVLGPDLIFSKLGDPALFLDPVISHDGQHLAVLVHHGWNKTQLYVAQIYSRSRSSRAKSPMLVFPREHEDYRRFDPGVDATFDGRFWRGKLVARTNWRASRYRLVAFDLRHLGRGSNRRHRSQRMKKLARPREIVAEAGGGARGDVLDAFEIFGDHLVLKYMRDTHSILSVALLTSPRSKLAVSKPRPLVLPPLGSVESVHGADQSDHIYFSYESYLQPRAIFQTRFEQATLKQFFATQVPFDRTLYKTRRVMVESKDHTMIPVTLVGPRDAIEGRQAGIGKQSSARRADILLYGYGGFSVSMTPYFSALFGSWISRGGILAIPNLRGGGEFGEQWHRDGMKESKQHVFDDFIAVADYLKRSFKRGAAGPRLHIMGGSNGGLLVGAAMTQRPDLFDSVICSVPLLDMLTYQRYGSGKTWVSEYGSSDTAAEYRYLRAYSPYHAIKAGTRYPDLLMLSADHDDRVHPVHARKFVAALRHAHADNVALLRVEQNASHRGADSVDKTIERAADILSFLRRKDVQSLPMP